MLKLLEKIRKLIVENVNLFGKTEQEARICI